ncbi:MAG: hypothetical protein A2076_16295 [Geobacteraceae bacterium GWC2_53_11]|nr:MAG: hypothetical protein A2076_16295 [Geobacteraceae bacterium GWC2_53_11]
MKNSFIMLLLVVLTACAADVSQNGAVLPDKEPAESRLLYPYAPSGQCKGCHADQYMQYEESMHAKAFTNPLFNTQYFKDVVPRAQRDPALVQEARKCIACHAPTVFMNYTGLVSTPEQANNFETGVTCDFCHTLAGYADNGDYLQNPSGKKQGPFQISGAASHHSEYSGFMQLGDYCGRCHNATNHVGLEVKSTYYEWRESSYGKRGFACQECHMNKNGFLRDGNAEFDRGQAAQMNLGLHNRKQQEHEKLYNHAFPGAHSISELQDALLLDFKVGTRAPDEAGRLHFTLVVNNERSGHKMPSGSSDLRFMWLVVNATTADGATVPVELSVSASGSANDYSIAGASSDDAAILQNDVPKGARLYRTVLINSAGRQSLYQYDAVENVFDNRLNAAELRKERYYLKLPALYSGKIKLEAHLYYRAAPSSFTKRLQIKDFSPVLVASQKKVLTIEMPHAAH